MKLLKTVMTLALWFIGLGVAFAIIRAIQDPAFDGGGAAVQQVASFLPILVIAGVIYLVFAGVKKLSRR